MSLIRTSVISTAFSFPPRGMLYPQAAVKTRPSRRALSRRATACA
jgi:hypothetical protein